MGPLEFHHQPHWEAWSDRSYLRNVFFFLTTMDPYATWDDLAPPKAPDEDFAQYFVEYKNFDNLFNEALTTLQDLDVPSGYANAPPALPFKHAKKPSGTAIFGFTEHTRDLSFQGEKTQSISPTQLARRQPISNEHLDFNFSQPLEACKPIHLAEDEEYDFNYKEKETSKKNEDFIVTKSYKFPPELYPDDIDALLDKRYVPIPVVEPRRLSQGGEDMQRQELKPRQANPMNPDRSPIQNIQMSPQHQEHANSQLRGMLPSQMGSLAQPHLVSHMELGGLSQLGPVTPYLPPPSSLESPEPHSPLQAHVQSSPYDKKNFYNPQFFSDDSYAQLSPFGSPVRDNYSPVREGFPHEDNFSPIRDNFTGKTNYSPVQKFHSKTNYSPLRETYNAHEALSPSRSSYHYASSPVKDAFDETVDANETIVQLTPLKHQPMTPSRKITLEWSPIISPDAKASGDVRRAILELSPKRIIKKTSLLPPGELDRYWEGPDEDKVFTCTFKNCGKKFTRRYNVRSHIQTHLSDRPFTCTYCPKSFVRQHDLNRHIKSHMVAKNCRCRCGKDFTRVEGYRKHIAKGVCLRPEDSVGKPRHRGGEVLDGLTSSRLSDELGL